MKELLRIFSFLYFQGIFLTSFPFTLNICVAQPKVYVFKSNILDTLLLLESAQFIKYLNIKKWELLSDMKEQDTSLLFLTEISKHLRQKNHSQEKDHSYSFAKKIP